MGFEAKAREGVGLFMSKLVYLVPLFPLIGFLINGLGRKILSKTLIGLVGSGVILASFAVSLGIFFEVKATGFQPQVITLFEFIKFLLLLFRLLFR